MNAKPVVVITGANSGIGRAAAERMLKRGWTVVATARDPEKFHFESGDLHKIALNVTSEESVAAFRERFDELNLDGAVHLVNNAGLAVAGPVEAVPIAEWDRQLRTNVLGVVRVTQALLPRIRATKGRIVNIGSVSGRVASPFLGPYAASKFALRGLNDSLRREMNPLGVHVVLIEPGPVKTPIWEKSKEAGTALRKALPEELVAVYGKAVDFFTETAMKAAESAVPVSNAADAVETALTARNPKPYLSTSASHAVQGALGNLVPGRWLDRLIGSGFPEK